MKLLHSWLNEYVPLPDSIDDLSRQLTQIGLEVDDVRRPDQSIKDVRTATVTDVSPHPNNDDFFVCEIQSADRTAQVVTAGSGVEPGSRYLWAVPGSELPAGKVTTERFDGIESEGLLCSVRELGFSNEARHLLEIPTHINDGLDAREVLNLDDVILELDLTPNRSDCLSYLGIARDFSSAENLDFQRPELLDLDNCDSGKFDIEIDDPDDCSAYLGMPIDGVTVDHAPFEIQSKLIKMGVQPRNNVVDFTNYTLLEMGHPLHAFDRDTLSPPIEVRRAHKEEELLTLDGENRELDQQDLLITDNGGPIALAGIMGGEKTAVDNDTNNLLIESAYFNRQAVRNTSGNQKLHTEASHRFERGVDPDILDDALARFAKLLDEQSGKNDLQIHQPVRCEKRDHETTRISFRSEDFEDLIGFNPGEDVMKRRLEDLGCEVSNESNTWTVETPSWRHDLERPEDLIEEILRLRGYENVPNNYPSLGIDTSPIPGEDLLNFTRDYFSSRGFHETVTFSFVPETQHNFTTGDSPHRIRNPLSSENETMRQSVLDGLAPTCAQNVATGADSVRLFEIGRVFPGNSDDEHDHLGLVATGPLHTEQWDEYSKKIDFMDVKGLFETYLNKLGYQEIEFKPNEYPGFRSKRSASVVLDDTTVGRAGEIQTELIEAEVDNPVIGLEVNLTNLPDKPSPQFESYSDQPFVNRDLDLVVDEEKYVGDLRETIYDSSRWLEKLTLFDLYHGDPLPEGKKSVSFNLHFRKKNETLSDQEVNEIQENILDSLRERHNAELRDE